MKRTLRRTSTFVAASTLMTLAGAASAQQTFTSDVVIQGSLCVGYDCVTGEVFGADTVRLKENNLNIHFDDTSASGSFPSNDWRLTANSPDNGGESFFAINDATSGRQVFTVEAAAIANAMYISEAGDVGLGTASPIVELHAVDGNSPTLRLEQDGSSGFTPQTWDIAGNEANFFVRDVTYGSKLPFRIEPNTPDEALFLRPASLTINEASADYDVRIESDTDFNALFLDGGTGNIGMGTGTPEQALHIVTSDANTNAVALVAATGAGSDAALNLRQAGTSPRTWEIRNQESSGRLNLGIAGGNTVVKIDPDANNNLMRLGRNGLPDEVNITGRLVVNNTQLSVPDYVFSDSYTLRPLAEVAAFIDANSHLPEVPSEADIKTNGVDMTDMQMVLLKKVEELTLYTLAQQATITEQDAKLAEVASLRAELAEIKTLLADAE